MNKIKNVLTSPFFAIGAFALAAVLLLTAGIGGASAALSDTSEVYELDIATQNIGVQISENGTPVVNSDKGQQEATAVLPLAGIPDDFRLNTEYPEVLTVTNTGEIDEYVRVIVYKYWTDASGSKLTYDQAAQLSPATIDLHFAENNGWKVYDSTDERTILNYSTPIGSGEATTPFADTISFTGTELSSHLKTVTVVTPVDGGFKSVSTTTFDLGTVNFVVEVEADGVQTHNAAAAMMSAWGYVPDNAVIAED